jgi:tetratricopeptide (TPR) repeat protein
MYSRKHILRATFFIILAGMLVTGYLLKPTDVRIAHYYESLSMYKEAIAAYEESLKGTKDQGFQKEILIRISILCRYVGDDEKFLITVKRLLELEYNDPKLMKDGMGMALYLWDSDQANKKRQDDVVLFATKSGNRNFLMDFLLGNHRVGEAISLYDEAYNSGNFTEEQMKKAITVSRWTGDIQTRKRWLERAVDVIPDAELMRELFIVSVASGDEETALRIAPQVKPKTLEDFLSLADLYEKVGDKKKAKAFYAKAEAICVQKLAAIKDKTSDQNKKLMTELVYLYWKNGKFEQVVDTVEDLHALGCKDKKLMDDALNASLHLWRENPDNRENQERVIRIAENMGKEEFLPDFYIWNKRHSDALKIYEKKWQKKELSTDDLRVAMEIAGLQSDRAVQKKWFKRGAEGLSHDLKDKGLMDDALNASLHLWRENPDNRENQERVIRIAGNIGKKAFLLDFYVWNKRYSDALEIYEKKWEKDELAPKELKRAVQISCWQNDRALQKKWLKRGTAELTDPEIIRKLANMYLDDQEYQSAKELYVRLEKMEPSNKGYLAELAYLSETEGNYRAAYDLYKRAYNDTKKMTYLQRMVSCAYHLEQSIYEDSLRELAGHDPTEENLFRLASFCLYVKKNYKEANEVLEKIVHDWPLPKYQVLLSYSFFKLGDNPAAIDLLKRIPPKFQQPWSIQLLSKHYQEHGKWNKAIEVIKDYIKFHPDDTNTLLCLAYIYKRLNWKDEYQELIQSLLPSDGMERMHEQHLQKSPDSRSQTAYPQPLGGVSD